MTVICMFILHADRCKNIFFKLTYKNGRSGYDFYLVAHKEINVL